MTVAREDRSVLVKLSGFSFDVAKWVDRTQRVLSGHERLDFEMPAQAQGARDALFAPGLFAPSRLIVLWNANRAPKELRPELERWSSGDGTAGSVLMCVADGRQAKWYKSLVCDTSEEFATPKPWEWADWVMLWARNEGYDLGKGLAQALVQNVGEDPHALTGELTKSFVLMGQRRIVEPEDITRVLVQHSTLKPWLIADAWAARKPEQADRLLTLYAHQTQDTWSLLPVISMLLSRCQHTLFYVSARASGMRDAQVSKQLGVSGKAFSELTARAAAWDVPTLRRAYEDLCRIEVAAKTGRDAETALHLFMYSDTLDTL